MVAHKDPLCSEATVTCAKEVNMRINVRHRGQAKHSEVGKMLVDERKSARQQPNAAYASDRYLADAILTLISTDIGCPV